MRAPTFIVLSILMHLLVVAAIAMPIHTANHASDATVEMQVADQNTKSGVENAPVEVTTKASQAAAEPETEKAPVEIKKPAVKETVKKSVAVLPKKVKAAAAPIAKAVPQVIKEKVDAQADENSDEQEAQQEPEKLSKEIETAALPVKEEATEDKADEAAVATKEETPKKEEVSSAPVVATAPIAEAAVPAQAKPALTTEVGKGGATEETAVSVNSLKQVAGNKGPAYPMKARMEKRQGQMELLYRVTKEGRVTDIQVAKSTGFKDLDDEAVRAVAQFKFQPGQEGWARHPINFALKGETATLPSRLRVTGAQAD